MLRISIEETSSSPVYRRICNRIAALIDGGSLYPGDRLPSTRELAKSVGVHRSTIVRAYEELRALGYLDARPGSYSTVRRRARPPSTRVQTNQSAGPIADPAIDWAAIASPGNVAAHAREKQTAFNVQAARGAIDFSRLAADPTLAPIDDLRRCFKFVLSRSRGASLDYIDSAGRLSLRETIAARMRAHGVAASSEEIVITNGAQHALDMALRLLTRPGDRIAVEAPSYSMIHALLRLHDLRAVEIPMLSNGMDLAALEAEIRRRRPVAVYTMPTFHNPTGITMDQAHRERLLGLCESHRIPLIEDGFEEEMKYFGQAVMPIKSMDTRGTVIYVGTFSKLVFPGLRLGWIVAPRPAAERLISIQHVSCLSGNALVQAAVERFCAGGDFELYLRRVHRVYRRRMRALLRGLEEHMPPGVEWTKPTGGYTLWLALPGAAHEETAICEHIAFEGVSVAPGSRFFASKPPGLHARLSIACIDEAAISEGCRRLGRALKTPIADY